MSMFVRFIRDTVWEKIFIWHVVFFFLCVVIHIENVQRVEINIGIFQEKVKFAKGKDK